MASKAVEQPGDSHSDGRQVEIDVPMHENAHRWERAKGYVSTPWR
jgi:hypothetical protein